MALTAAIAIPLAALSRPATREILRHTDPDGKVTEYRLHGDENFSFMTDTDCNTVLEIVDGRIAPAVRNGKILTTSNEDLLTLKSEVKYMPLTPKDNSRHRMAALDFSGRTTYPTIGEVRSAVILLEFADTPYSSENPNDQFTRFCNEKGYSDYGSRGSAKDYFESVSKGKFSPKFDVYGPVKLKHNAQWYVGMGDTDGTTNPDGTFVPDPDDNPDLPGYQHHARMGYAIKEAIEALDPVVDFSIYDYDNNGDIDNIFFFYSGYGQADSHNPKTIWPHQANFLRFTNVYPGTLGLDPLFADGKQVATYATSCELNGAEAVKSKRPWLDGIGAFCHEFGHVIGLPDLYSSIGDHTKTPGKFSVMADGNYNPNYLATCPPQFSAYEMWLCRWLELDNMEDGESYTLQPLSAESPNAVRLRIQGVGGTLAPEYYIFECRDNTGWDSFLPENGMIVWRINYNKSVWQNNQVNVNYSPNVEIISPDAKETYKTWPGEDMLYTYSVLSMNRFTPACRNGKALDFTLSNISFDYEEPENCPVTFDYNKYRQMSSAPLLHDNPTIDNDAKTIRLKWDKIPEATDYALTVTRNSFTVGDLKEKYVGDVNQYDINCKNFSEVQLKQTFTAYVRAYNGIPSSKTSNIIRFVPANLSEESGVNDIDIKLPAITGGKGCIHAPEGARIFTLSGIETDADNLPAGVYIVICNGVSAKVNVF